MTYSPKEMDCLLIPVDDVMHLHIVMNDPCSIKHCLLVMISSIKAERKYDNTCVLDAADYEDFITHPSYVVYRIAETMSASRISAMVEKDYYVKKEKPVNLAVYNRIADGLYASEQTRRRILQYAKENGIDSYTF